MIVVALESLRARWVPLALVISISCYFILPLNIGLFTLLDLSDSYSYNFPDKAFTKHDDLTKYDALLKICTTLSQYNDKMQNAGYQTEKFGILAQRFRTSAALKALD